RRVERAFDLGSFADPGADGPWQVTVNWGDGSPDTVFSAAAPGPLGARPHTYAGGGRLYAVTVVVREGVAPRAGGGNVFYVPVDAPAVVGGEETIAEGAPLALRLPDLRGLPAADPLSGIGQFRIVWGDGTDTGWIAGPPAGQVLTHAFAGADGPAAFPVGAQVEFTAEPGRVYNAGTRAVTVADAPPAVGLGGPSGVPEGSPYTLTLGPVADPGADAITTFTIHWGDGISQTVFGAPGGPGNESRTHTYADNGAYTITVDATDEDGTHAGVGSRAVAVADVAPTVRPVAVGHVFRGAPLSLGFGPVVDPGADTVSGYTVDWGDGSVESFGGSPAGATKTHTYAAAGTYTVAVALTNEDGTFSPAGTTTVVVDPPLGATQLAYGVQPSAVVVGGVITPAVTVRLLTADGGLSDSTAPVTLALAANPGGATLGGTRTVNAVGGVATFANLTLNRVAAGYTLRATSPGLTEAVSAPFDVLPPAAGVTLIGTELYVVGSALNDSAGVSPTGTSRTGSTGVSVTYTINGVNGTRTFRTPVTAVWAYFGSAGVFAGHDAFAMSATLTTPASVTVGDGNNVVTTGAGADTIAAGNGGNVITAGAGHDTVTAGNGTNTVYGGDGNDRMAAGNGRNTLDGGAGDDTATLGNGDNTVTLGAGNDTVTAGNGANTLDGGVGNDTIAAGNGNNAVTLGAGNDTATLGNGQNAVTGGDGNDLVVAGDGRNTIDGGAGNDMLVGGRYVPPTGDTRVTALTGGAGNDLLVAGAAAATNAGDTLRLIADDWARLGPTAANLAAIRGRLTVTYTPGRYRVLGQAGTDWFWYAPGLPPGTLDTDRTPSEPVR
ncbi:MAG: PKD domain-containing protein, partial [Gemmataceae bacterium]|nr:PKD domain-containing protein [Gemmataceae bacterium]